MKRAVWLPLLGSLCAACAGLPTIVPSTPQDQRRAIQIRCRAAFVPHPFRAVHRIEASLPLGEQSSLLGVVLAEPNRRRFRAVLLSIEGLTLLDVTRSTRGIAVHRAVPPLDDEGFGRGLADDVALALLLPDGELEAVGRLEDGRPICRFRQRDRQVTDVIPDAAGPGSTLLHYDAAERLRRRVKKNGVGPLGLARWIELGAPGLTGYRLELTLFQAEAVSAASDRSRSSLRHPIPRALSGALRARPDQVGVGRSSSPPALARPNG